MTQSLRMLIVEDCDDDAILIVRELERSGYALTWERVQTAKAMQTALREQAWDLIIADYSLPEFDAPSALALVQQTTLDIPLVVVSGTIGEDVAVAMMRNGAHDYIMKDNLTRLVPAVERELREARERRRRREAEEALRESEERHRTLVESAPDAIFTMDEDGRLISANQQAARDIGTTPEGMIGKTLHDLFPAKLADRQLQAIRAVFGTGETTSHPDWQIPTVSGHKWYHAVFTPLHDPRNKVTSVLGIARDVTDLKAASEALRESESKYRTLLENLPQKIFLKDRDSVYISCNENYASDRKIQAEDIPGTTDYDFFPAELADKYRADDEMVMKSGKTEEMEERYIQDGHDVFVQTVKTPVRDANGSVAGILGIFWDITDRKRAEEALRASEERFLGVVDNTAMGVCVIGPGMEVQALNKEMQTRFPEVDVSRRPMCYRSFYDPPRDGVCPKCPTFHTLSDGQVHESVIERRAGGETRHYRIVSSPLRDAAGSVTAVVELVDDITERKRAEEAMVQASRLDSLALLAGGIAHDFNNVLTGIVGNISLARLHAESNGDIAQRLADSETACMQARSLTQQLLTFANGGAPIKTATSLPQVIENSVAFALAGSNVRCEFSLPDDMWPVEVDQGQINQAISNLVINADQAMPDGGTVTVRAENVLVGAEELLPLAQGRYVKLSVRDRGVGIAPEHLDKIFDPYFTTKQMGSGLGLATTHSIIKKHDGAIAVHSKLGSGTTFHLYLPASDKPVPIPAQVDEKPPGGTGRILVMDDEEMVREVGARMLTHLGYHVEFAQDGAEAIALYQHARESGEPFDAVVMDLTIPGGMGGKEAIRKLREIDPDVKAIASSGYSTDPAMANYEEHGFVAVVPKPYQTQELGRAVHEVVGDHRDAPAAD